MRLLPARNSPTYRRRGSAVTAAALSALLAVFLMAASTACGLMVEDADIVGTFEERDGDATIALNADGTGTLSGYDSDYPEVSGSWSRHLDAIDFVSNDLGRTKIIISSADELWTSTDVDGGGRREFERSSDEEEEAAPTETQGAEEPGVPCADLSALLDAAEGILSDMEADVESGVPGEQLQLNASNLTLFGLQVEPLVPEDIAAHARTLADAGSAITEAIENGGTLTDIITLWVAPEVLDANATVQVYYDGESGCES